MIRIAFVINQMWGANGGTEGQLMMLIDKLDPSRFQFHLVCLGDTPWLNKTLFNFPTLVLHNRRLLSTSTPANLRLLRNYLKENHIDIVQTFFLDADLVGIAAAHFAGIPVTLASRRNIGHFNTRFTYWLLGKIGRWVDWYLCNSEAAARAAIKNEGAPANRVRIIYNGLDLSRFARDIGVFRESQRTAWGVSSGDKLVGLVAHLRHVKNVPSLMQAAQQLAPCHSNVKYVVIGDGPLRQELEDMVLRLGLNDRFQIVGATHDIVPCLAALDIGVLCSKAESFSNALIEYMAAGLPIVASNVGGVGEAIAHHSNGLLYDPDDPEGLVNGLKSLLDDPSLGARLGANAKINAFSQYSHDISMAAHESFYQEVLASAKDRGRDNRKSSL